MLKKGTLRMVLFLLAAAASSVLMLASCSAKDQSGSLSISLASSPSNIGNPTQVDEQGSTVLRCSSLVAQGNNLMITASKSKDIKATTILFLLPREGDSQSVTALAAPVGAVESEYDISRASVFTLDKASADAAAGSFGIPFADWQEGAMSDSGKFPCCE
jgi:hypothetical protein